MQINSSPRPNPYVARDLKAEVQKELGDSVVDGFADQRVSTLRSYYFDGEEFVGFEAAKSLGDSWKEVDSDHKFHTKEFVLEKGPNGDSQSLTLNTEDKSVKISTVNREPGPFEGFTDIENMMMTSDGQIIHERFQPV